MPIIEISVQVEKVFIYKYVSNQQFKFVYIIRFGTLLTVFKQKLSSNAL